MKHLLTPFVVLGLLVLVAVPAALADDKEGTHEGLLVKASNNQVTMTDMNGKNEHTHDVSPNAAITCDGKQCKLDDLEKGCTIKVTLERKEDKMMVTKIEAKKEKDKKEPPTK
jgi:hypothetical protein